MKEDVKQVIVVRKDLNMRKGKMAVQVAHASLGALLSEARRCTGEVQLLFNEEDPIGIWLNGPFVKICVSVDSEAELLSIYEQAKEAGQIVCMITDAGFTEFHNIPTKTCVAIGPGYSLDIDKITGNLKLL